MNFIVAIFDGLVEFIRRNPITSLVILVLAIAAPSVLKGVAVFILYFVLGMVVLLFVLLFLFRWRIYRLRREVEEQIHAQGGFNQEQQEDASEGEVRVYKTEATPDKRVSKDVGDYVEFEETEDQK